jgi:hypothetical protein
MTDGEIKDLLNSDTLSVIEDDISRACNTYVNRDFIEFTVGILRREITNSGLPFEYILQQLKLKRTSITQFGLRLFMTLKDSPLEEEYPQGEEIPKSALPKDITSHGLGTGFGVKYAIYLHFLETNPNGLLDYIKKERIPKAQQFYKTLQKVYNS